MAIHSAPTARNSRRRPLGPFSYQIMCLLHSLPKAQRYSTAIEKELNSKFGENVVLAQVYVALNKLCEHKLAVSESAMSPDGSFPVYLYTITPDGYEELKYSVSFYRQLVQAAPRL